MPKNFLRGLRIMRLIAYTGADGFVRIVQCETDKQAETVERFLREGLEATNLTVRPIVLDGAELEGCMGSFGL